MNSITGETATPDASRIMRRLCKHWSHKYTVDYDDSAGVIELNDVRVSLRALPDRLIVTLENPNAAIPQRLLGVVSEHLQRMAGEQVLDMRWSEGESRGL